MPQQNQQVDGFKAQMREVLLQETLHSRAINFAKHSNIYRCGDKDAQVYFIESGQIKLLMLSPDGRECLLAILTEGDIFGELCLSGLAVRMETATAMEKTNIKQIPYSRFLERLGRDKLFEGFLQYLAVRIANQQQVIADMVMTGCEQRLGKTLFRLADTIGKKDPCGIRIESKLSHEELSEMVGTTRSRISVFMQHFRNLGLLERNEDNFLIIKDKKLSAYLEQSS